MTTKTLDDSKISTIANGLRVAADRYIEDAKTSADVYAQAPETARRMADQFNRQAAEARSIADMLEQADTITIHA
ncbi:MAG TPA: hypothetical protein VK522_18305 [Pseudolabrys sp.]|nr:hypothetical protein [Pseudolabrys sp.]